LRVAVVVADWEIVVIVNRWEAIPRVKVRLAGKVMALDVEVSFTTIEPLLAPGAVFKVSKPTALVPPMTVEGVMLNEAIRNGVTESVAV